MPPIHTLQVNNFLKYRHPELSVHHKAQRHTLSKMTLTKKQNRAGDFVFAEAIS